MTGNDNQLWLQSWRDSHTDFHQATVNRHLVRFWSSLGLLPGARVFVPLCGKSLDMVWLASQGYQVIGVELSPVAVRAFFKENRIQPKRRTVGALTLWESPRISIFCGDFFSLEGKDLGDIAAVFDRASLTALGEDIREAYLAHMRRIVPAACKILLLTTEEPEDGEVEDQPFAEADEITGLYAKHFEICLSHVESVFEADPDPAISQPVRIEQKVYLLSPKAA